MNAGDAKPHVTLDERLRFETLLADLSSVFVNLPSGEVDRELVDAQRQLCQSLGLDFSTLWQWSAEPPGFFKLTHFYSPLAGPEPPTRMTQDQYPWAAQQLLAGRIIAVATVDELPVEAGRDRETLRQFGIKSNLALPLAVGGEPPFGILGLGTMRVERSWPDALVVRLKLVAQIFANALARRRSEDKVHQLSLALEQSPVLVVITDLEGKITYVNRKFTETTGYSPAECLGQNPRILKSGECPPSTYESLWTCIKGGGTWRGEFHNRKKNGELYWERAVISPLLDAHGQVTHYVGVKEDVTVEKWTAAALRASEARLAAGTELAGLGYYEVDYGARSCFLDDRFRNICGIPPDVRAGLKPVEFWLENVHPDDRQLVVYERQKLHDGRMDHIAVEYRYGHPAHGQRWLHHSARVAERNAGGAGIRTFGVVRDVTTRKRAELEALELRNNLTHLARVNTLGQLASALAHELSQPLGAILRNAEAAEIMLREPAPDLEELRAIIADILRDDQRAGQVIDRLRSLLKRRRLDLQPIELSGVIAEVMSLVHADAATRHVRLDYSATPGLPKIRGDRIHLQQVLLNLFINAMDAMEEGTSGPRCIQVGAHLSGPDRVEVRVCDNGPGVPAESLERLFDPFFTTKVNGMGMGLAVSKTIVEAHQGRLWAENRPEGGACFCFAIPITDPGGAP